MPYDLVGGYTDIVGDELVGDDLNDLLTAAAGAKRHRHMMARHAHSQGSVAAQKRAAAAYLVQDAPFTKARDYPIGFDSGSTLILTTAQATVTTNPQIVFKGERLVVPSDIAGSFTIDDIRVGNRSQLVAVGSIPARTFEQTGVSVELSLDTCQISMNLTLVVTNISGGSLRFRAAMLGKAVQ